MIVDFDFGGQCHDGTNTYLGLQDFSESSDQVLFYGLNSTVNIGFRQKYKDYKRKILLDLWSPCSFVGPKDGLGQNHFGQLRWFDQVYSICPYTVKWTNNFLRSQKMKYCYYPLNHQKIQPTDKSKQYDVCFVGGIHGSQHAQRIDIISKYNKLFITQSNHGWRTHRNLLNTQKIKLIAKAKIGLCYNLLYLGPQHVWHANAYNGISQNQAFRLYNSFILPQFKSRVHQFALCKTLILCKKDPWNVIQGFYTPQQDFIYFNNNGQLSDIIQKILSSYGDYEQTIQNAYKKAKKYTSQNLIKMIRGGQSWTSQ